MLLRFVADDVLHELHTALYRGLIEMSCDDCPKRDCDQPWWIDGDGAFRRTSGDMVGRQVSWPACPGRYECLREQGSSALPLSQILAWNVEQDAHKSDLLGYCAAAIYREYLGVRGTPRILAKNKHTKAEIERAKQKARRAR